MSWENELYFLSTSLAGWSLGLKDNSEGRIEVWFARLLLGWIDPASASFFRADIRPKKTELKKRNYKDYSVTDVLTQKCYRCFDRTPELATDYCLLSTDYFLLPSGRADLNRRPLEPHSSALPS